MPATPGRLRRVGSSAAPRVPCAGAIVFDAGGRLLLIQRGRPPDVGHWSVPGGRCLPDEPPAAACVREAREETGLQVTVVRHAGQVLRAGLAGALYVIDDYVCQLVGGRLRAGDDAADARFVDRRALADLPLTPGLWDALAEWQLLPR